MRALAYIPMAAAAFIAAPASAQNASKTEWHSVLVDLDVVFRAKGERQSRTGSDKPSKNDVFIVPLKLKSSREGASPVSARMVCYAGVHKSRLSAAELDLGERYSQFAEKRKERGFVTEKIAQADKDGVRVLHAVGQRGDPHEHFAISLIAAVKGDTVVSVTRNCVFQHAPRPLAEVDFLTLAEANTEVRFTFPTRPAASPKKTSSVQPVRELSYGPQDSFYLFEKFVGMLG